MTIGAFYRLINLGVPDYWVDEYYHVFASQNLIKGLGPILPSGLTYMTAFPYTLTVTLSRILFGGSAFAVRLPSVIFGLALIPAVYFLAKKYIGNNAALIASVFVAFDPFGFWWSRLTRMYSMFELVFFITALILFGLLLKDRYDKRDISKWFVFVLFFALTVSLQMLGMILIVITALYLLIAYFYKLNKKNNYYLIFSILTLLATIAALYISKSFSPSTYYLKVFTKLNPLFLFLVLGGFSYNLWKKKKLGIFSGVVFFAPLLIHSFFFPDWTHSRYLLYALPFAYISISIPAGDMVTLLLGGKKSFVLDITAVVSIIIALFFGKYMIAKSYQMGMTTFPEYQKAAIALKKAAEGKSIIISTLPISSSYYVGKTDYYLRTTKYERYIFNKNGKTREMYSGAVLLNEPAALQELLDSNNNVFVFAEERLDLFCSQEIRDILNDQRIIYSDIKSRIKIYGNENVSAKVPLSFRTK